MLNEKIQDNFILLRCLRLGSEPEIDSPAAHIKRQVALDVLDFSVNVVFHEVKFQLRGLNDGIRFVKLEVRNRIVFEEAVIEVIENLRLAFVLVFVGRPVGVLKGAGAAPVSHMKYRAVRLKRACRSCRLN